MLTEHALNDVVLVMDTVHGFDLSIFDESFVQKAVGNRCTAKEIKTFPEYITYLSNNMLEAKALVDSLNINHTDFFRNSLVFANLEQWILPKLVEQKSGSGELRIWSAGCSSGQEPYSAAMLLDEYSKTSGKALRYRIIATDIYQPALDTATKGEYNEDAVQNIKSRQLKEYFTKKGNLYGISPRLKEHINFSAYDLLDKNSLHPHESIFGNFDIVFCSNVLFYYRPEPQRYILQKLIRSMNKDGYLITGEAEMSLVLNKDGLQTAAPPAPIFMKSRIGDLR